MTATFFCRVLGLAAVVVLGACGVQPGEETGSLEAKVTESRARVPTWGMIIGEAAHAEPDDALADMQALGIRAVRFEAPYENTSYVEQAGFATNARAHGMQVLMLVQPRPYLQCLAGACSEEQWLAEYASKVAAATKEVSAADVVELGNEPNGGVGFSSPDVPIYKVPAAAFAKMLVRGGAAAAPSGKKIVSGGLLNVNLTEPLARAYVTDVLSNLPASPPFDYFGIHPYNPGEYRDGGAAGWATFLRSETQKLGALLTAKFHRGVPLWVTEIGRSVTKGSFGGLDNIANGESQASSFRAIDNTLADIADHAFWYNYRDDEPSVPNREDFGVRVSRKDGGAKKALYATMQSALTASAPAPATPSPATPSPATPQAPSACGTLGSGGSLTSGQSLLSCDRQHRLTMQDDGNLVLYGRGNAVLWATYTVGRGQYAKMQNDGNFVLVGGGQPLFDTHTDQHFGAYLAVQDDGNMVVYYGGRALFDTHTSGQ